MQAEGQRVGSRFHPANPPEAAHQLLEGQRAAGRVESHDLCVQDEWRIPQVPARDLDDVG